MLGANIHNSPSGITPFPSTRDYENRNDRYALKTRFIKLLIPKSSYLSSFFENRAISFEVEIIDLHYKKYVEGMTNTQYDLNTFYMK